MKIMRTNKHSFLVRLCVFAFAVYVAFTLVSLQMEINAKKSELAEVTQQIKVQEVASKELERQISLGENDAYLARIARDKLDLAYPNERIFRDASGS